MKTFKKLLSAMAISLSIVGCSGAYAYSGNELLGDITSADPTDRTYALGFIRGVVTVLNRDAFCLPNGVTMGQLRDIVQQFISEAPQHRHERAEVLTIAPLIVLYPCADKPARKGKNV